MSGHVTMSTSVEMEEPAASSLIVGDLRSRIHWDGRKEECAARNSVDGIGVRNIPRMFGQLLAF